MARKPKPPRTAPRPPNWHELSMRVRGTYVTLVSHVVNRHAGGKVTDARLWNDLRCREELGVSSRAFPGLERRGLIRWEGDDLVLEHYEGRREP